MAMPSKRRQRELVQDKAIVQRLYEGACGRWGEETVQKDLTRIWDLRCTWGIQNVLPFDGMVSRNLSEVLWVAENVCNIQHLPTSRPARPAKPQAS